MASVRKSKPKKLTPEQIDEATKRDAMALAELVLDIYKDKKRKEQKDY